VGTAAFLGLALHCARPSPACSASLGGRPDRLPDEPGGYDGYNALYGQRYLSPRIAPSGQLTDLEGRPLDRFPGFGAMTPSASLGYAAAMQEHGVPVTFAYLSDPHYSAARGAFGPGEPGYVQQLQDYDRAFALFLDRLKRGGIGPENTLFVVSSGESARFVGAPPRPTGCDGAQTQCGYEQRGAIEVNLPGLLAEQQRVTTPLGLQDAAGYALWVKGDPGSVTSVSRTLEKAAGRLVVRDPYSGASQPLGDSRWRIETCSPQDVAIRSTPVTVPVRGRIAAFATAAVSNTADTDQTNQRARTPAMRDTSQTSEIWLRTAIPMRMSRARWPSAGVCAVTSA